MCMICYPSAPGTVTTNTANGMLALTYGTSTWPTTFSPAPSRACGYIGCENVIAAPDFPWSMCDECSMNVD